MLFLLPHPLVIITVILVIITVIMAIIMVIMVIITEIMVIMVITVRGENRGKRRGEVGHFAKRGTGDHMPYHVLVLLTISKTCLM